MGEISREGTKHICRSAWRAYTKYTKKTATELKEEAIEDAKREVNEGEWINEGECLY